MLYGLFCYLLFAHDICMYGLGHDIRVELDGSTWMGLGGIGLHIPLHIWRFLEPSTCTWQLSHHSRLLIEIAHPINMSLSNQSHPTPTTNPT